MSTAEALDYEQLEEIWKYVPDSDEFYEISNLGRVRSWKVRGYTNMRSKTPKFFKPRLNSRGYLCVTLSVQPRARTYTVHKLVSEAFLPPKPASRYMIDHLDDDKTNNRADNLQWLTNRENIAKGCAQRRSLPTGVRRQGKKFSAQIGRKRKYTFLGMFSTSGEASVAYQKAVAEVEAGTFKPPDFSKVRDLPIGVSRKGRRFMPRICYHGKNQYLGLFATPEEASEEYQKFKYRKMEELHAL